MRLPLILLCAILLLSGCAALPQSAPALPLQAHRENFTVPPSGISYTAHYRISDGSGEAEKTVWRAGQNARVRLGGGESAFDLYFLSDRAYSCSSGKCFEVTAAVGREQAELLFSGPDLSGATEAETVKVGSISGRCYLFPSALFESRKKCFTQDWILAYDEYNATKGQRQVEYLTELSYGTNPTDFVLPYPPQQVPAFAQQ